MLLGVSARNSGSLPNLWLRVIKRPSTASISLALIPVVALGLSVSLWDRITPRVLGVPFNMFWIVAWLFLTPVLMSLVYRMEKKR